MGAIQSRGTGLAFKSRGNEAGDTEEAVGCDWWRKALSGVRRAAVGDTAEELSLDIRKEFITIPKESRVAPLLALGRQAEPHLETQVCNI